MSIVYCTVLDYKYLPKGLAFIRSLTKINPNISIYVLCLDISSYNVLNNFKFDNVFYLSNDAIQNNYSILIDLKKSRNNAEYAWTCKSFLLDYLLEMLNPLYIIYVDVDTYFFSDPTLCFDFYNYEYQLTPHNFSRNFRNFLQKSGEFNAGYFAVKNCVNGKKIISRWMDLCIDSCTSEPHHGSYGDQKYLENISIEFSNRDSRQNIGLNVAPWNIENYELKNNNSIIQVNEVNLVFYHFQAMTMFEDETISLYCGPLTISPDVINIIYLPYIEQLTIAYKDIRKIFPEYCGVLISRPRWFRILSLFNFFVTKHKNIMKLNF
jgi:hypothetical protein